jgi:hypothetical protein
MFQHVPWLIQTNQLEQGTLDSMYSPELTMNSSEMMEMLCTDQYRGCQLVATEHFAVWLVQLRS